MPTCLCSCAWVDSRAAAYESDATGLYPWSRRVRTVLVRASAVTFVPEPLRLHVHGRLLAPIAAPPPRTKRLPPCMQANVGCGASAQGHPGWCHISQLGWAPAAGFVVPLSYGRNRRTEPQSHINQRGAKTSWSMAQGLL